MHELWAARHPPSTPDMDIPSQATRGNEFPLRVRLKRTRRASHTGTISCLYSAKNDEDLVVATDVEFAHALSMEADERVASYEIEPGRVVAYTQEHEYSGSVPDAIKKSRTGEVTFIEVKYLESTTSAHAGLQADIQRAAAEKVGARWCWFTEHDAAEQERLIHDWLAISVVLKATRSELQSVWDSLSSDVMGAVQSGGEITLETIKTLGLDSWSLVFSTVFRLVALGRLHSDLAATPLSPQTRISMEAAHGSQSAVTAKERPSLATPPELLDYRSWPSVDPTSLPNGERKRYLRLKRAIEAKCDGKRTGWIQRKLGVSRSSLSYFMRRCTERQADGRTRGYRALVKGDRQKDYVRKMPIKASEDGRGMAGALNMLLAQHASVQEWLDGQLSGQLGKNKDDAGLNVAALHGTFLKKLRAEGVGPEDYPFCTERLAYDALTAYVRAYIAAVDAAAKNRYGEHAGNALSTMSGRKSVLRPLRCLERVAYDEYKIPDIATLVIQDEDGEERDIPICRAWFCPTVDFKSTAVLGFRIARAVRYGAMELLGAVESTVAPKPIPASDMFQSLPKLPGEGLPGLVIPHVRGKRIACLVLDNDLAHGANVVVGHLRDRTGVTLSFGRVRSWIERYVVEGLFSELQTELTRLASTTGSGTRDPSVTDPVKHAVKQRIREHELVALIAKLVARHNAQARPSLMMRTPNEQMAFDCAPERRWAILPPYDEDFLDDPQIAVEIVEATVRGSRSKGVPPYVQVDGRYSSDLLRQDWTMVGKKLCLHIPEDSRLIRAFQNDGKEYGLLSLRGPFARTAHDRATRKEINRLYRHGELREHGEDPVTHYQEYRARRALIKANVKNPKISREASELASILATSQPPGGIFRLKNGEREEGAPTPVKPRGRSEFFGRRQSGDANGKH